MEWECQVSLKFCFAKFSFASTKEIGYSNLLFVFYDPSGTMPAKQWVVIDDQVLQSRAAVRIFIFMRRSWFMIAESIGVVMVARYSKFSLSRSTLSVLLVRFS